MCQALLCRIHGYIRVSLFKYLGSLVSTYILPVEKLKHREVTCPVNEGSMILTQAYLQELEDAGIESGATGCCL